MPTTDNTENLPAAETDAAKAAAEAAQSGDVPDWVKDPARAYAEIQKVREEAKKSREALATIGAERKKQADAAEAEARKKLEDEKQFQQLAEKYKAEAEAMKAEAEAAKLAALRVEVAAKVGIPALAARLVGKTDAELTADAEALKALLAPAQDEKKQQRQPGSSTTPAGGARPQGETDEQRRARLFGRGAANPLYEKRSGG